MTGIFRANNPLNIFLLFVYGILLKSVWLIHPPVPVIQKSNGFLFNEILAAIKPSFDLNPVMYTLITYLFLFTQAISFNQILNSRRQMQKPNYLPAMSYLLITSFFGEWNILSAPLVVNTLLIWAWGRMSNLYNNSEAKTTLFNIGIAVGLCAFFYFPSIAFGLLIFFALLVTRPFRIPEWIIALAGILTPWYFLFVWLFLTDQLYSFHVVAGFKISPPVLMQNKGAYAGIIILVVICITGGIFVQSFLSKQVVQVRKNWALMLLYLLVALLIPFINLSHNFEYWILAAIPVSAFAACAFFYPTIKWVPPLLHWAMAGFVIYMEYLYN